MSEPTEQELRRIAHHMVEVSHFGKAIDGECPSVEVVQPWLMAMARAAWHLGARHDGRGEVHGPTRDLGGQEPRR